MKQLLILLILFSFSIGSFAQKKSISSLLTFGGVSKGLIYNGEKVAGYFYYASIEDISAENRKFEISIKDEYLNPAFSLFFTGNKYLYLSEVAFNDSVFLYKFAVNKASQKKDRYKYFIQKKGEELVAIDVPSSDLPEANPLMIKPKTFQNSINSVKNMGFVITDQISVNSKFIYSNTFIDNNGKVIWKKAGNDQTNGNEIMNVLANGNENFYTIITEFAGLKAKEQKNIKQSICINNIQHPEKSKTLKLEDNNYKFQVLNGKESSANDFDISGLYFAKTSRIEDSKPIGVFSAQISSDGFIKNTVFRDVNQDFVKFARNNKLKKRKNKNLLINNVTQRKDGKTIVSGFSYSKSVNLGAVLYKTIFFFYGGFALPVKRFKFNNLYLVKYDMNMKLEDIQVYEQPKLKYAIAGMNLKTMSLPKLATYFNNSYLKDHFFIQNNYSGNQTIFYYKFNEIENDIKKVKLNAIIFDEKRIASDKFSIGISGNQISTFPNKFGFVYSESFNINTRNLNTSLDKVNF